MPVYKLLALSSLALCLTHLFLFQSCDSETDLIKLDDSPTNLEDFDPLMCRDKKEKVEQIKSSNDSALLHEYGLDFSQFGLFDYTASSSARPDAHCGVPKGWTTFN